jgi:ectoine hydroxylase
VSPGDLYPSRVGGEAGILVRKDPVVHASEDVRRQGPLSEAVLERYEDQGFLAFDPLLTPEEVAPLVREARRLAQAHRNDASPHIIREPGDDEVRSIFRIHEDDGVFAALVHSPLVRTLADQLLGAPWYLHQSRINYKPAFRGRPFYWHSDFETWHVEDGLPRMRTFSLSINLTENRSDNGPLMLMPGSHRSFVCCTGRTPEVHYERSLQRQEAGLPPEPILEALARDRGIESPTGAAGSAILFDCNLMHGSNGNITPFPRTNVFLVFNRLDNALVAPFSGQPPRPEYIAHRDEKSSS